MRSIKEMYNFYKNEGFVTIFVDENISKERISLCESCEKFNSFTRQCRLCSCFMDFKTKLEYDPFTSLGNLEKTKTICADKRVVIIKRDNSNNKSIIYDGESYEYSVDNVNKYSFASIDLARNYVLDNSLDGIEIDFLRKW
jgi:hypothetical protein